MGVALAFGSQAAQLAMLGSWISVLAGLIVAYINQAERHAKTYAQLLSISGVPSKLLERPDVLQIFGEITVAIGDLASQSDPILKRITNRKLCIIAEHVEALSRGEVSFVSTESWRTVYEQVLRSNAVRRYRSVAWFKSEDYWQDQPGRHSLELNLEMCRQGLSIERIIVVADHLWAEHECLPVDAVIRWARNQHANGIKISLVRESEIRCEQDLCVDFGIYDDLAVGVQELDDRCRTMKFLLFFDEHDVATAKDRWKRLSLYARPLQLADSND